MNEFRLRKIAEDSEELSGLQALYEEAFPEEERRLSLRELLRCPAFGSPVSVLAVVWQERSVGFAALVEGAEEVYGLFFAMDKTLRGNGFGSRVIPLLAERYGDRPIFFGMETPLPEAGNFEQRVKRSIFYERLGMRATGVTLGEGTRSLTVMTNRFEEATLERVRERRTVWERYESIVGVLKEENRK